MSSIGTVIDPKQISAVVSNPNATAVSGINNGNSASGFLGGPDPIFRSVVGAFGRSNNVGVFGFSDKLGEGTGVAGNTNAGSGTGVHGHTSTGVGVLGTSDNVGPAGRFVGNVEVTGDITVHDLKISGGDCAEEFEIAGDPNDVSPGTVMVMDETGALRPNRNPYDKKVVGVVSGAGEYQPGIILDRRESLGTRVPIALVGKAFCKADARNASIEVGDLLTTSATLGHAMKADHNEQAFGAVIGKALKPLHGGQGLIPILIALQ